MKPNRTFPSSGGWPAAALGVGLVFLIDRPAGAMPPPPAHFMAQPRNAEVVLQWNAVLSATGYNVWRASGASGPYSLIASNVVGTAYTNTGVNNGATVYYRVSALTPLGETPPTARLPAQPGAPTLDILPAGAAVERLAGGFQFVEGPVWVPRDGGYLVFSDIDGNRLLRWRPDTGATTFRQPSNRANGNTLDLAGRLVTCEQTGRRVSRTELDGTVVTLVNTYSNRTFNAPNDVVVKSDGTIWFTDPNYGGSDTQPGRYVYRFHPDDAAGTLRLVASGFDQPNGLCFSPDESLLYVADSGSPHLVRVFDVQPDNTLANGRTFAVINPGVPDGIRAGPDGRLYVSAGNGVQVFSPAGALLGTLLTPETPANLGFGGPDGRSLFITARTSLYGVTRLPDLVVTEVIRSPAAPMLGGQSAAFTVVVRNQGTGPTPAGIPLRVSLTLEGVSNAVRSTAFSRALEPGAAVVLACTEGGAHGWTSFAAGTRVVAAWVDDLDQIAESNETNNVTSISFNVSPARPDTDGDGMNDLFETRAGTDTNNPASVLRIDSLRHQAGKLVLTWASVPGKRYRVACKSDVNDFDWVDVTESILATEAFTSWTNRVADTVGRVVYRIRLP